MSDNYYYSGQYAEEQAEAEAQAKEFAHRPRLDRIVRLGELNMTKLFEKHIELIEAVNNAQTHDEHDRAETKLRGFREALDCMEPRPMHLVECDHHYLNQGIDRPMCCGVWLDWVPNA